MTSSTYWFSRELVAWQKRHGRHDLPWQRTRDAYRIWLSEIMLQQTQVATVIPYYQRFLARFPSVEALASAPLDAVLESWSGLGYYARARNLHRCAQAIVEAHGGCFPAEPERLAALPGIGRSTAAAIAVFAFGARAAILDGNVKRVLSRCFGIETVMGAAAERNLWALAESLLPDESLEAYTQGLMDLGATLCVRGKPDCARCPLAAKCVALSEGRQAELPTPRLRKVLPEREIHVLLLTDGDSVLMEKRPAVGIWGGLLSLPERAWALAETFATSQGCRLGACGMLEPLRHQFTHFALTIRVLRCEVQRLGQVAEPDQWVWLSLSDIERAALPAPIRTLLATQNR